MKIFVYSYSDPLLESAPEPSVWGWEVDKIFQDLSDRHQFQQLLDHCRTEPDSYVLVRSVEELGESVQMIGDRLAQLESLGVQVIAVEDPTSTHQQPGRSHLLYLLQAIHQSQHSRRIRRGHARNRVKALPPPGKAPYGYRRGKERYIVDRTTAPIVKEFFDHFLLYGSLRGSIRHLQKKYNKKISASTGKRWLTSPVYRGNLVYQTGDIIPDTHPPLLSRQEAAQIDRLLRRNSQMPTRTASAPRSLAGLVSCATCQSPMTITRVTAHRKTQEYLYLRPMRCPNQPKCKAIAYAQVLEQTIQRICEDLPPSVATLQMPPMDGIKQGLITAIAAKEAILSQLPALLTNGILDTETADLRAYKLRSELAQLQAQLSQLPPVDLKATVQAVSIPQFWQDLSEAERRFYFREFLRTIQIVRDGGNWRLQLVFIF